MIVDQVQEVTSHRCPRCGSPLIHNGTNEWCTFVGGYNGVYREKACSYGIDMFIPYNDDKPTPYAKPSPKGTA